MQKHAQHLKRLQVTLDNVLNEQTKAITEKRYDDLPSVQMDLLAVHGQISAYAFRLADEVLNGESTSQET